MARKVKVNMTGVESYTRCPEGEWLARLKKIEIGEVQGSGDDALKAQFEVIKGSAKGNTVFETFSLSERALWKLKSFLDAIGMKSDGKLNLDLDKMEGKICIIDVNHEEYNGSKRAKISAYIKPSDDPDDDEEDDEDEDDEEEDEEEKPVKQSKKAPAKSSKKKPDPEEDDEDEDDEEEDDDEDDEEPPRKSKKPVKKTAKKTSAKKSKKDEDEDDDWEDDED